MTSYYFHKSELNLFSLADSADSLLFQPPARAFVITHGRFRSARGSASLGRAWLRRSPPGARLAHEPRFHREQGGVFKTTSLGWKENWD